MHSIVNCIRPGPRALRTRFPVCAARRRGPRRGQFHKESWLVETKGLRDRRQLAMHMHELAHPAFRVPLRERSLCLVNGQGPVRDLRDGHRGAMADEYDWAVDLKIRQVRDSGGGRDQIPSRENDKRAQLLGPRHAVVARAARERVHILCIRQHEGASVSRAPRRLCPSIEDERAEPPAYDAVRSPRRCVLLAHSVRSIKPPIALMCCCGELGEAGYASNVSALRGLAAWDGAREPLGKQAREFIRRAEAMPNVLCPGRREGVDAGRRHEFLPREEALLSDGMNVRALLCRATFIHAPNSVVWASEEKSGRPTSSPIQSSRVPIKCCNSKTRGALRSATHTDILANEPKEARC